MMLQGGAALHMCAHVHVRHEVVVQPAGARGQGGAGETR